MAIKEVIKAVAYYRTSSATNVGTDRDSEKRQREAVRKYTKANGFDIVDEYYDAAVMGADPVNERPEFARMMDRLASNGVRTILVETASRFARDLIVQETGWRMLRAAGIDLVAVDSPDAFLDETPTAVLIRQILGAVSQFEKAMVVAKLAGARKRKAAANGGKCEGRKTYAERNPEMVVMAKKLARYPVKGARRSLRNIARDLEQAGFQNEKGKPFAAAAVARMIRQ